MGASDRFDDRQAEPGPATRASTVAAREALECPAVEGAVEAGAAVEHVQAYALAGGLGEQLDGALTVPERVVNKVGERLLRPQAVGVDGQPVRAPDAQLAPGLGGARLEAPRGGGEQLTRVEALGADGEPALVGTREDQQVLRELHEPVALARRRRHRLAQLLW